MPAAVFVVKREQRLFSEVVYEKQHLQIIKKLKTFILKKELLRKKRIQ